MITEYQVIEAYRAALRMKVRKMNIERNGREETDAEQEERIEAICAFDTLELQYLAEKA